MFKYSQWKREDIPDHHLKRWGWRVAGTYRYSDSLAYITDVFLSTHGVHAVTHGTTCWRTEGIVSKVCLSLPSENTPFLFAEECAFGFQRKSFLSGRTSLSVAKAGPRAALVPLLITCYSSAAE